MSPQSTPCFVIIVHHGSPTLTGQLVHTLLTNSTVPDHIVVVDHGHPDSPLQLPSPSSSPITVFRPPTNTGYGGGLLLGLGALLRHTPNPNHTLVLCLNNDVTVTPQAIARLSTWWSQQSPPVIAGIRAGYVNLLTGRAHLGAPPRFPSRRYLHGAALAGTLTHLARYLPPDYFLYSEDVALSWRAVKNGLHLEVFPSDLGIHHDDNDPPPSDQKLYYLVRNGARVLEQESPPLWRHYWRLVNPLRRLYHRSRRHSTIVRALHHARQL